MIGIDKNTGQLIAGKDHLRQSLEDLLTTRKGTRVMMRDYGSDVPNLIDLPVTAGWILDVIKETAGAIEQWETRLKVSSVKVVSVTTGQVELAISGTYLPDGSQVTIDGIVVK